MSPEMWRVFIAVELPNPPLSLLSRTQADLKRQAPAGSVRWVAPEGIHLTLKFLGDVPVTDLDAVRSAMSEAARGHTPFTLETGSLGCFPNATRPRVIWIGIERSRSALNALRDAVETHVAPLGYPTEDRPFSPHLTLGRVRPEARRDALAKLGTLLSDKPTTEHETWTVDRISLMRSELKPGGAVYTEIGQSLLHPSE
ncbi:MAG TPA: RNA 2',3'-cyclic phosphodiesterase [Aggregatilinea sp.]|uniref:RNA 2',3'-cyclic phosphodiesterase n=1 Tax=Aggregatilinea sp. TaxID=2806333 RepID=UPI002B758D1D|nr:RNA 2',3'-cyclic phosphodiesterase [Aggregatilinea sp.]HML20073.1 RNA 2',3'-cyclic phosphodiesterase [Aggregatilinea sp.]